MPDSRFAFSNFQPAPVTHEGLTYPTVEHFYQAMKTLDPRERELIRLSPTPGQAMYRAKGLILRPNWNEIKLAVMWYGLSQKFAPGTGWAKALLATGDHELVEWNTWHDNDWGHCTCTNCRTRPHENNLGRLLMRRRVVLREGAS